MQRIEFLGCQNSCFADENAIALNSVPVQLVYLAILGIARVNSLNSAMNTTADAVSVHFIK